MANLLAPMLLLFLLRRVRGADLGGLALRAPHALRGVVDGFAGALAGLAEPLVEPALVPPVHDARDDGDRNDELAHGPMIRCTSWKRRNYSCARTGGCSGGCWAR